MSLTPDQPEQQAQAAQGLKHTIARAALGLAVFAIVTAGVVAVTQMTTAETIADFIDAVVPAIEIVDYRYESWAVGALCMISISLLT